MLACALFVGRDSSYAATTPNGASVFQKDFQFYWQTVADDFAYFGRERTRARWNEVLTIYRPLAANITDRDGLIRLLEHANNELYNGHITLGTNLRSSNRIVPTGADMWAEPEGHRFVIKQIRPGFNADLCGLRAGMELETFNGIPIRTAIRQFLPKSASRYSDDMLEYAVNMLLAGTHDTRRTIVVRSAGHEKMFRPDQLPNRTDLSYTTLLSFKRLSGIGYIKINNSLGDVNLIEAFDRAVDALRDSRGLILDLTETPSGGNTTVARGILGRFVSRESPYQKIVYPDELRLYGIRRVQLDLVSPREKRYGRPVVLLVNRWTGSMAEGLAIGFAAARRARIVGSRMAGLLGATCSFETPATRIGFSIPCQETDEVNGAPRQNFVPIVGLGLPSDVAIAKRLIRITRRSAEDRVRLRTRFSGSERYVSRSAASAGASKTKSTSRSSPHL